MQSLFLSLLTLLLIAIVVYRIYLRRAPTLTQIAALLSLLGFASGYFLGIPVVRSAVDQLFPQASLYLASLTTTGSFSAMFFTTRYHQSWRPRWALAQALLGWSIVAGLITYAFATELAHVSVPIDWTAWQNHTAATTPGQQLFTFVYLGYGTAVLALTLRHQVRLLRREIDAWIRLHLLIASLSTAALGLLLGQRLVRVLIALGGVTVNPWPRLTATLAVIVALCALIRVVAYHPRGKKVETALLWPVDLCVVFELWPLHQLLLHYQPLLFALTPSPKQILLSPKLAVGTLIIHAMDSYHLLAAHPDPQARVLYRLLEQAEFEAGTSPAQVIRGCRRIGRQLWLVRFRMLISHGVPAPVQ